MGRKAKVIVLSATSDGNDNEGTEAAVLKELGFRMYKNQIFKHDRGDKPVVWEEKEMADDESKLAFLKEELKERAVIMFCEAKFLEYIAHHIEYTLVDLSLSAVEMRRLDEKHKESYKLIVSDDANLLSRGIDFRGGQNGLTFLQTKSAPTKRAMDQLGFRVGRMGEDCRRVRVAGIQAVDSAAELQYRKRLMAFLNFTFEKPEKKESTKVKGAT